MAIAAIRNEAFSNKKPAAHIASTFPVVESGAQPQVKFPVQGVSGDLYEQNEIATQYRHNDDRLLTRQVADKLGVSERWVRDHTTRRSPRIHGIKLGLLMRYRREDVDLLMAELDTWPTSHRFQNGV